MSLIHEAKTFLAFFRPAEKKSRVLTLYSEGKAYGKFFVGLAEEILRRSDLKISYITADSDDPVFSQQSERFKVFCAKKLFPLYMPFLDAKAFVTTTTDLGLYFIRRSMRGARHFYIFHSLVSTHMIYPPRSFDGYDTLLCAGPHHVKEIRRREELYHLPKKELLEGGYFLVDQIYRDHQEYLKKSEGKINQPRTCLIAPSWAPMNILESCLRPMITGLIENGYRVIIRPHPFYMSVQPEKAASILEEMKAVKGVEIEIKPETEESLHQADVLITDWSGIALEYAFGTERPVLYLDTPRKVNNPDYEKLGIKPLEDEVRDKIGRLLPVSEAGNAHRVVSELIQNKTSYQTQIAKYRKDSLYHFQTSAQNFAESLIRFCR